MPALPDGDAAPRRTILAYTKDGRPVTFGPVNRPASLERLRQQAESIGLTVAEAEARHFSAADLAALAARQTAGSQ